MARERLNDVFVKQTMTKEQLMARGYFQCLFFDLASNSLSSRGCSLVDISEINMTCSCTHMTEFGVFFDAGVDVLASSNYNIWHGLK